VVVVYTPGGGHRFYEELGPLTRNGTPDRRSIGYSFHGAVHRIGARRLRVSFGTTQRVSAIPWVNARPPLR
jgi:hypothetical protein